MARFVSHEPCQSCGSRDNFARYDDGGGFCFGCHYSERATHAPMRHMGNTTEDDWGGIRPLPDDIGTHFSKACVEWLGRFHVDVPTAIVNGLVWSPSREQLIFQLGNCWQARNFRQGSKSKNFTSGDVNECLHIYGKAPGVLGSVDGTNKKSLVVVEDPVSALRIGPVADSMPLLGSHLAQARLNALAGLYDSFVFWLDSDKYKEARAMEQRAKFSGLSARTVYTELDPKCYTNEQIREILGRF